MLIARADMNGTGQASADRSKAGKRFIHILAVNDQGARTEGFFVQRALLVPDLRGGFH